jgi:glucokinase
MFLGIEIGGTKLQLALGEGDGKFLSFWRGTVDPARGGEGIRERILEAVPQLLRQAGVERSRIQRAGVGFGGPIDDDTQTVIVSHQIEGWTNFPLACWLEESLGLPCVIGNDADVAGLAEATLGAGKGLSPIFYMTIGSGIGGGLIVDGKMFRGVGRGAAEVGHLRILDDRYGGDHQFHPLEHLASGWGIGAYARTVIEKHPDGDSFLRRLGVPLETVNATHVAAAARAEDELARLILLGTTRCLAEAIRTVIVLLCPRRVVIGGGVSLIGERHFFEPLRRRVEEIAFAPFAGLTEIVPATLGEGVVVHGAIQLAKKSE